MNTTAIERIDPLQALTEKPWYDQIDERQLAILNNTVAKGLSPAETGHFLELARSLGMNPWANEIWCVKSPGSNGGEGKLLMMVGRDGLIGKAERDYDDYLGYDAGCVYANDEFARVEPDPDSKSMRARAGVLHKQAHPSNRGDLLGAWAVCERASRPPRYFYAALSEYMPVSDAKKKYSPWGSAVAVMIEKVPISITHRTLCGLGSAVHIEEEMGRVLHTGLYPDEDIPVDPMQATADLQNAIDANVPPDHVDRLIDLIEEMNGLAPYSWTPAKVELVFKDKTPYAISAELAAIEKQIEELRARAVQVEPEHPLVPEDAEIVEPEAVEAEATSDSATSDEASADASDEQEEIIRRAHVTELEEALKNDDLADQQRSDIEAELDLLTNPPQAADEPGELLF